MRVANLKVVSIANQASFYGTNTKRGYALDVSSRSQQSRMKLECIVRILFVSTHWISHSGLSRESSLSVLYEY